MKYLVFISVLVFQVSVSAEHPEHYLGEFSGKEKFDIKCSNSSWNKSGTRDWYANHNEVNGNNYNAEIRTGGGRYFAEGTINGIKASGDFKGKDSFGNDCMGEFTTAVNGDQLTSESHGSCPAVSCTFTSEISATRSN